MIITESWNAHQRERDPSGVLRPRPSAHLVTNAISDWISYDRATRIGRDRSERGCLRRPRQRCAKRLRRCRFPRRLGRRALSLERCMPNKATGMRYLQAGRRADFVATAVHQQPHATWLGRGTSDRAQKAWKTGNQYLRFVAGH